MLAVVFLSLPYVARCCVDDVIVVMVFTRSKPWDYLGHLVGHEGKGSVLAELKDRGWATAMCAGVSEGGYDSSTCCAFFTITITLTGQVRAGGRHTNESSGERARC